MVKHTHREMLQHLLDGGEWTNDAGSIRAKLYDDSLTLKSSGTNHLVSVNWFENWNIYIEPKWHDNIPPEGILCRVWDNEGDEYSFENIIRYNPDVTYPYRYINIDESDFGYRYAEPLNEQEIAAYNLLYKKGTT